MHPFEPKILAWYLAEFRQQSEEAFVQSNPHPVLLHTPHPEKEPQKAAWKTSLIAAPDPATLSKPALPRQFDPQRTQVFEIRKSERNPYHDRIYVGRASSNDVIFDAREISKSHAFFTHADGHWALTDVGSRNGTAVDDNQLTSRRSTLPLADECAILFGYALLVYYFVPTLFARLLQRQAGS